MKIFLIVLLLITSPSLLAQQYRSKELLNSGFDDDKTPEQLAKDLPSITDPYSRDSTARFLARNYRQKQQWSKAAEFYQQALQGEGLSKYAKQETALELANLYQQQKNYHKLLETLALYKQFEGKLDDNWQLQQALAYLHTGQKSKATTSTKPLLQKISSINDNNLLQGLLYIYVNSQAYSQAAITAEKLLQLEPTNTDLWLRLSHIYIKANNFSKAANTLLLAEQNGLALQAEHLQLLIQLQAKSGNPHFAARLLQQAINDNTLQATDARYQQLFQFWYLAKDYNQAAKTLEKTYQLYKNTEHLMLAAKLYQKLENWPKVTQAITSACENGLDDSQISGANLLLGLSFYQQQQFNKAQQAWVNATLLPGLQNEAKAYLALIEGFNKDSDGANMLSAPCTPSWAEAGYSFSFRANKASEKPAANQNDKRVDFEVKAGLEKNLVLGSYQLSYTDMAKKMPGLVMQLAQSISKSRGKIAGPLHIIFQSPDPQSDSLSFSLAFPVSKKPELLAPYQLQQEKGFKHAVWRFKGKASELPQSWEALYKSVLAKGLTPTGENRQVIIKSRGETIEAWLQLGLKP